MELSTALARFAHALGRRQAAWRFAPPQQCRAAAIAEVSAAWETFRRDAGPGAVGPAHEIAIDGASITCTDDPRRDGLLLWLADHGTTAIAEAAGLLARAVGATRVFEAQEQELLQVARDAVAGGCRPGPLARLLPPGEADVDDAIAPLRTIAAAADLLRSDPAFVESAGAEVLHKLPRRALRHYVPAEPGATWAFNLALLGRGSPLAGAPPPGLISRALFRSDLETEDIATAMIDTATAALVRGFAAFDQLERELARGLGQLSHLSRNARAADAWLLVAALGSLTRMQLARALGLSRAGADIQAKALADAGLVTLGPGGRIEWQRHRPTERRSTPLEQGPLGEAAADLDATMADIDRLLARTLR